MLDHALGGSILVRFSKPMREDAGTVTYNSEPRPICFRHIPFLNNAQILGVFVRDIFTEYGKEYTLRAEGFIDEDGIMIEPYDIVIRTDPQQQPDPRYAENEEVALEAAREGSVLLKNNGVLPLTETEVSVYGEAEFRNSAVGAGKINPRYSIRIRQGLARQGIMINEDADTALVIISRASGENYDNNALPGEFYLSNEEEMAEQKTLGEGALPSRLADISAQLPGFRTALAARLLRPHIPSRGPAPALPWRKSSRTVHWATPSPGSATRQGCAWS